MNSISIIETTHEGQPAILVESSDSIAADAVEHMLMNRGFSVVKQGEAMYITPCDRTKVAALIEQLGNAIYGGDPCSSCLEHLAHSVFCPKCGQRLDLLGFGQPEIIVAIRRRIEAIAKVGESEQYDYISRWLERTEERHGAAGYELESPRSAAFNNWLESQLGRALSHVDLVLSPADADLVALQARLDRPIFVYGRKADIIITADELERHFPGILKLNTRRGSWLHDAMIIEPSYPNICCLMRTLDLLAAWLDAA